MRANTQQACLPSPLLPSPFHTQMKEREVTWKQVQQVITSDTVCRLSLGAKENKKQFAQHCTHTLISMGRLCSCT